MCSYRFGEENMLQGFLERGRVDGPLVNVGLGHPSLRECFRLRYRLVVRPPHRGLLWGVTEEKQQIAKAILVYIQGKRSHLQPDNIKIKFIKITGLTPAAPTSPSPPTLSRRSWDRVLAPISGVFWVMAITIRTWPPFSGVVRDAFTRVSASWMTTDGQGANRLELACVEVGQGISEMSGRHLKN